MIIIWNNDDLGEYYELGISCFRIFFIPFFSSIMCECCVNQGIWSKNEPTKKDKEKDSSVGRGLCLSWMLWAPSHPFISEHQHKKEYEKYRVHDEQAIYMKYMINQVIYMKNEK